ncbi:MAG TPA: histidine phosphatase family protein [Microlunatus sp.]
MATTVWYETHSTTTDNENGIATGWLPGELSALGRAQADDLGTRIISRRPAAIFASDLARTMQTVTIARERARREHLDPPVFLDWRLRECDYGELNGAESSRVHADRTRYLTDPYPGGESWTQAISRIQSAIKDFVARYRDQTIIVVGHSATGLGIQAMIDRRPPAELITAPFVWQPGWVYRLDPDLSDSELTTATSDLGESEV